MGLEICFREHTADEEVLRGAFGRNNVFFAGVPEYRARASDIIIDVGAHIGTFNVVAASRTTTGRVHAIEPCKESFNYLMRNVTFNSFTNVFAYHCALGDHRGLIRLYHNPDGNWRHTIMKEVSTNYETVPMCTLEDFMVQNNIQRCDFLKMNCEGAEFPIIMSTPAQVLRRIGILLVLYHLDLAMHYDENRLIEHLRNACFDTTVRRRTTTGGWIIAWNRRFPTRRAHPLSCLCLTLWRFGLLGEFCIRVVGVLAWSRRSWRRNFSSRVKV